jgi:hypothetical protein
MADLTITAANVLAGSGAQFSTGTAGATVTAGQPVYQDATDSNKWKPADGNASLAAATVIGIALHASLAGQPLKVQTLGDITIGATVTVGGVYVLSATAGGIAPVADLASGNFTFIIGIGKTASVMTLVMKTAGVAVP